MVKALVKISTQTDPYANLATEHLLMGALRPDEAIMFLWQNSNTIVVGRNQDAYRECRVEEFENEGGSLARRLSGGGAVYHDTGNLNFTFISSRGSQDVARNLEVICTAVRSFGVEALASGRNDIEVDGAKFSGNAFFNTTDASCHHGTLMVDVDTEKLARYLLPDPRKLGGRGVGSVKSRIVNLHCLNPLITVESLKDALIESFSKCYGVLADSITDDFMDGQLFRRERERFKSTEWRLRGRPGPKRRFNHRFDYRYSWGGIDLQLQVDQGVINEAHLYSDALEVDFIDDLARAFQGTAYQMPAIEGRLGSLGQGVPSYQGMLADFLADIKKDLEEGA